MKHLRVALSVLMATMMVSGFAVPAQAGSNSQLSAGDRAHILDFFRQYSVPESRWEPLLEAMEQGKRWDSLSEAAPTNVEVKETLIATEQISRFADGSVKVTSIERPTRALNKGSVSPMASIQGCTYYGGSGYRVYRGCGVSNQWGNIYLGFNADYQIIQGYPDQIDRVFNATVTCWGFSCSAPYFDSFKYVEDGWGAAGAKLRSQVSSATPWPASWDVWVMLNVGGDKAWATNS